MLDLFELSVMSLYSLSLDTGEGLVDFEMCMAEVSAFRYYYSTDVYRTDHVHRHPDSGGALHEESFHASASVNSSGKSDIECYSVHDSDITREVKSGGSLPPMEAHSIDDDLSSVCFKPAAGVSLSLENVCRSVESFVEARGLMRSVDMCWTCDTSE